MSNHCPECGQRAQRVINDNGVTDPAEGDRWEEFECPDGHTWTQVLRA